MNSNFTSEGDRNQSEVTPPESSSPSENEDESREEESENRRYYSKEKVAISSEGNLSYIENENDARSYNDFNNVGKKKRKFKNSIMDGTRADRPVLSDQELYSQQLQTMVDLPVPPMPLFGISTMRNPELDFNLSQSMSLPLMNSTFGHMIIDRTRSDASVTGVYHILQPLGSLPQYIGKKNTQNRAKRRCKLCSTHCSYYCEQCSSLPEGRLVCYCNPFTVARKPCYFTHLDNLFSGRQYASESSSSRLYDDLK